jgi:UDP-N-acetylmuramoylalanine--D-glutamate ligase
VLFEGTASEKIASAVDGTSLKIEKYFNTMRDAVVKASSLATTGDLVILCPGAASFNMFKNEFDRGEQFDGVVKSL